MVDRVAFTVEEVISFRNGVSDALYSLSQVAYQLEHDADEASNKAHRIFRKIETVLAQMNEDQQIAEEVRSHNQEVLAKYKQRLEELRQQYNELAKAYSQAYDIYKRACAEETRIHNSSVPSTGDPDADRRNQQARSQALERAHKAVREADHQCYLIKEAQSKVQRAIEVTQHNIQVTQNAINQLTAFISHIQNECDNVQAYRSQLQAAVRQMEQSQGRFRSVRSASENNLNNCLGGAEKAIALGRNICNLLDPDQDLTDHDSRMICFSDINALERMSNNLMRNCQQYEDASDLLQDRAGAHENAMQDNVISESALSMYDVQASCAQQIRLMRKTARNCREASRNLKEYANLSV